MELRTLPVSNPGVAGEASVTVLRIDPLLWDLEFAGISQSGEAARTAREWCASRKLTACINAGMFATDYKTHLGYVRFQEHEHGTRVNHYLSVAAFGPKGDTGLPRFRIFDLDAPGVTMQAILDDYASAIQNLRLIKGPGENRWTQQEKKWSEAALGEDKAGRILFIFCRSPFSMYDLNQELLASDIGLVAAQHLEGGPEAQLYLRAGDIEREMFGSHGTSAVKDKEGNTVAWPVPNILGVRPARR